ncbi:MAG: type II toxin-antitoxin system YafQ family toxin [Firmicutes bacterium]|nr:type II toxin-antitoxin system YafQ family toxin [Bacillota bacterium]
MSKYKIDFTNIFKKDLKRAKRRGYDMRLITDVVNKLQEGEPLPQKNRDHALTGNWEGYRECHIAPDWLLIYEIYEDRLILLLTRTGTHSDLDL